MSERVKPLQVSPVIKISRYLSLICGIIYGTMKLSAFRAYEVTAKPRREKLFKEKSMNEKIEFAKKSREEIIKIIEELDLPEITPDWGSDI